MAAVCLQFTLAARDTFVNLDASKVANGKAVSLFQQRDEKLRLAPTLAKFLESGDGAKPRIQESDFLS